MKTGRQDLNICVIPARGGSKRIPRKNIKQFGGKPMIAWSIEKAIQSNCFDEVLVSTDDDEIAEISLTFGASVPFLRPAKLSDDYTPTSEVIAHAIQWLQDKHYSPKYVCCIYPTAPFISEIHIRQGLEHLRVQKCSYVLSVTSYAYPIQRALKLTDEGRVKMLHPENFSTRSQDLEETYHDAGQFYWGKTDAWLSHKVILGADSAAIVLPRWQVQDIDTEADWENAELMFSVIQSSMGAT